MKILALDTTGLVAGAAVVDENNVIGEFYTNFKKTHSQTLMPIISNLLNILELDPGDIDYVACASGPGSFTGLRIGAATAKAFAHSIKKPLIPVPALDALAYNVFSPGCLVVPLMDARRGQVYTAVYIQNESAQNRLTDYMAEDLAAVFELLKQYRQKIIFLGDGVPSYSEKIESSGLDFLLAPQHINAQRAASVGALAVRLVKMGEYISYNDFAPFYIRKSQAEREQENKLQEQQVDKKYD